MTFYGLGYNREQKIQESEKLVRDAYYKYSHIQNWVNVKAVETSTEEFLKLGRKFYIPSDWYSSNNIAYDIALNQFGENLAFSEEKYLLEKILETNNGIERIKVPEFNSQTIKEQLSQMDFNPSVIFAPIELFVDLVHTWSQTDHDYSMVRYPTLRIQNKTFNMYWSNKYTPFSVFIVINKSFGEWITKPSIDDRFFIHIEDGIKPLLTMYTTFKFSIVNKDNIKILESCKKLPEI